MSTTPPATGAPDRSLHDAAPGLVSASPASLAQWHVGTLLGVDAETGICDVSLGDRVCEARRADGCLLEPQVGDLVALLSVPASGQVHLVQVLSRSGTAEQVWSGADRVRIRAQHGLTLETPGRLSVLAHELRARFDVVDWFSRVLSFVSTEFIGRTTVARLVGEAVELMTGGLRVTAQRSYRQVSEVDQVRAGVYDLKAQEVVHVRSRHVLVRGQELAKVDGGQIHIG